VEEPEKGLVSEKLGERSLMLEDWMIDKCLGYREMGSSLGSSKMFELSNIL